MSELLFTILLGLYPREWRNRYGGEVRELVDTLRSTGARSLLGLTGSLVVGATVERLRGLRRIDAAGLVAAMLATAVVLGGSAVLSHRLASRGQRADPLRRAARAPRARELGLTFG